LTARLLLGKDIGAQIRAELRIELEGLSKIGVVPGLGVVLVGDDPGSQVYVKNKAYACKELGVFEQTFRLARDTTEKELFALVDRLNADARFHGILVQLPLPGHIDERRVLMRMEPRKDVDCFHPVNVGRIVAGNPLFLPATPAGIQQMLLRSGIDTSGKHVVICGRSNIVGKPLANLLMQKAPGANATVTVCHTGTRNLGALARQADILVAAMGRPRAITAEMVKEGAVVVDVGMNRIPDPSKPSGTRLVGDVDFEAVKEIASAITPVPGGVGPMTVTMLMANVVKAARLSLSGDTGDEGYRV
jgi:methylenetetrahydrofolate dehydrogenase (NADP+)/methenyltetrahydrofolate cyclohydrolase